ncbi:MAG TPA: hypothetical protein ENI26_04785, partial [Methylophaga aminisulfidivorans]|nr:hypothetical protein [Methylophaga aminisulfidivorans]
MKDYFIHFFLVCCRAVLLACRKNIKDSFTLPLLDSLQLHSLKTCFRRVYIACFIFPIFLVSMVVHAAPLANDDIGSVDEDTVLMEVVPGVLGNDSSGLAVNSSFTLNYSGETEGTPSDSVWEDETGQAGGNGGSNYDFSLNGETLVTSPITNYSGITQTYHFQGDLGGGSGGTMDSLQDLSGNPSDADASFELWFRPDDLQDADVLFETGNRDGMSLVMVDDGDGEFDDLHFVVTDGKKRITLVADLSVILGGSGNITTEFIQVVGVYDRDSLGSTDSLSLYINGTLVAQEASETKLNDWADGNDTGLGTVNKKINVGNSSVSDYEGDIAIFRFYESALSDTAVANNFNSVAGGNLVVSGISDGGAVGSQFALPSGALLTLNTDGSYDYNPAGQFDHLVSDEITTDSFTYIARDSGGEESNPAMVTVTITGANDAPIANADSVALNEGASLNLNLAINDIDIDDGLDLGSINIVTAPVNGSYIVNTDGTVDYSHDGGETLSDEFSYRINDLGGTTSNVATVSLTIISIDDAAPTVGDDSGLVLEGASSVIDLIANDSDSESGLDLNSISLTLNAFTNGSVIDNGDGSVTYIHDGSETNSGSFSYTIADNDNNVSVAASVSIMV